MSAVDVNEVYLHLKWARPFSDRKARPPRAYDSGVVLCIFAQVRLNSRLSDRNDSKFVSSFFCLHTFPSFRPFRWTNIGSGEATKLWLNEMKRNDAVDRRSDHLAVQNVTRYCYSPVIFYMIHTLTLKFFFCIVLSPNYLSSCILNFIKFLSGCLVIPPGIPIIPATKKFFGWKIALFRIGSENIGFCIKKVSWKSCQKVYSQNAFSSGGLYCTHRMST